MSEHTYCTREQQQNATPDTFCNISENVYMYIQEFLQYFYMYSHFETRRVFLLIQNAWKRAFLLLQNAEHFYSYKMHGRMRVQANNRKHVKRSIFLFICIHAFSMKRNDFLFICMYMRFLFRMYACRHAYSHEICASANRQWHTNTTLICSKE